MGYYTGTIFEIAHPSSAGSLGGGGRYDGMIGRFLGADVPAAGFSIGFERIVDLVELPRPAQSDDVALLFDADVDPAVLVRLKTELLASAGPAPVCGSSAGRATSNRCSSSSASRAFTRVASVTGETAHGRRPGVPAAELSRSLSRPARPRR